MIRVVIVEDDPMVAEFNRRYLELVEGFELIAVAYSADKALEILNKQEVDLVLLDIFMPGMNGLELLSRIRTSGKGVDVIIVSAACDSNSIKTALRFGATDYIIKPFEFERLEAALSAYRDLVKLMQEPNRINQLELDNCILYKEQPAAAKLPKGIDRNTLTKTWEKINGLKRTAFSTEEMASYVGISRVSMRKYLDFLKNIGVLDLEITYGTIGRPVYRYRCTSLTNNLMQRYLG
ncbi:response regulator|uniref:Transcriptional regulatory protein n=1 Tax=Dendrosporobacter quercicolus TaxID=146817 RepID=A0A1G9VDH5_9FIRM|nr:response regulator [Dendrosporobacter quercicolus]NSL47844.1 response regulator [Dendrosporobacter quercicolus DSM 1736]SDM70141.1 two-component system, CitB family, response regulator MalR [Dendrosporobacter quercicolus]